MGDKDLCSPDISDMFTFVQTPEGFILPKSYISKREIVIDNVDDEAAREINALLEKEQRQKKQEAEERKKQQWERKRKIAGEERRKKFKNQGDLFNGNQSQGD